MRRRMERLTVLRVGGAAAVAANVLDFFPDVAVNDEGHGAVLVLLFPRICVLFFTVQIHHPDQAEAFLLSLVRRSRRRSGRGAVGAAVGGGDGGDGVSAVKAAPGGASRHTRARRLQHGGQTGSATRLYAEIWLLLLLLFKSN